MCSTSRYCCCCTMVSISERPSISDLAAMMFSRTWRGSLGGICLLTVEALEMSERSCSTVWKSSHCFRSADGFSTVPSAVIRRGGGFDLEDKGRTKDILVSRMLN